MSAGQAASQEHGWYALYTRHQHEKTVASLLVTKGFEVFLPLYTVTHLWKDRQKRLEIPLFSCYVFIRSELRRRLDVLTTPGVSGFVVTAGQPSVIPSAEIEPLQRAIQSSLHMEPYPYLRYGDRVRIRSGPLEGIEGIIVRKKGAYRLILSVELLGRAAAVEVHGHDVDRAMPETYRVCQALTGELP